MFEDVDLVDQLSRLKRSSRKQEDILLSEAHKILQKDLFAEKKILDNLKQYARSFEVIDEEDVDDAYIFTEAEIRKLAIRYRLKFLDSGLYSSEIPYEAVLKVKSHDKTFSKSLRMFRILSLPEDFLGKKSGTQTSLFVRTNYGNYYLLHHWGKPLNWKRRLLFLPFRSFESLALTVLIFTLVLTLSLPTFLITLDSKATYWSGYRAAAFMHLLIFNFGVTVYFSFTFALNFSSSVWNRRKDFD